MKPLQEEGGIEDAVVLQGGADLPHVSEKLGRFPPTQQLHSQEQLHSLEVCELMAGQQGFLQLVVGIDGVRSHYQMHNIFLGLFIYSRAIVTWQKHSSCDVTLLSLNWASAHQTRPPEHPTRKPGT